MVKYICIYNCDIKENLYTVQLYAVLDTVKKAVNK